METLSVYLLLAVVAVVLAAVGVRLLAEVRRGRWQDELDSYGNRLRANDAALWAAVFGGTEVLPAGTLGVPAGDPVLPEAAEEVARSLETAFARGVLSLGPHSRDVRVVSCRPDNGSGWHVRRCVLRDAAGHRSVLVARFRRSQYDPEPPGLEEGPSTALLVHLDGIERAGERERELRERLSPGGPVPWDSGISR